MYRRMSDYLKRWKESPYRKPLLLQGARQVGKTYSVVQFGEREYANVAYFNFERNPTFRDAFAGDIGPEALVPLLSRLAKQMIAPEHTLLVFDEIQLCERALTSLKYFCEDAPQYHVIAAGSLLGIAVNRETFSFPVGKIDRKTMYPMDFEEFLVALGEEDLRSEIRRRHDLDQAMPPVLHEAALGRYRQYLALGGMPASVRAFLETDGYVLPREVQSAVLADYLDDMSKYNTRNEIKKTRLAYESIPAQLSKANTRFRYKLLKSGARASEFEEALEWLVLSGVASRIYQADVPQTPLANHRNVDAFKIYSSDAGLLGAQEGIVPEDILLMTPALDAFKGAMTENYAQTQLVARGYRPYFWQSDRGAEVDFLIEKNGSVVPVEVKAADNVRSRSLRVCMDRYKPDYAVRLSAKNFGFENGIRSVPLYAAFCL